MPKVSVIVPTYNRGYIVRQAINSILAQTLTDIEVLVVDDGSTDDTKQVVELIKDARIKYFYKENGGVSSARNFGLSKVRGEYVAFLDSDDIWPKEFLRATTETLDKNPDFGLAYTATTLRLPDGREEADDISRCLSGRITAHLFKHSTIWPSAVVIRRSELQDFWFDEALKVCEDSDAFLRLSARTKFMFVPDIIVKRKWSQDSHSVAAYLESSYIRILSLERFCHRHRYDKLVSISVRRKKLGHCYRRAGQRHRRRGYRRAAICLLKRAIRYKPTDARLYIDMVRAMLLSRRTDQCPEWQMPEPLGPPSSVVSSLMKNNQALKMISNIVFTRNRPLQLDAYLCSLYRHIPQELIQTYVIYKVDMFDEQHSTVFERFPHVVVIRESNFHDDFISLLEQIRTKYILFGTDDVVYYDSVGFDTIDRTFERFSDDIFGFTLRLCPENLSPEDDKFSPLQVDGETIYRLSWKDAQTRNAKYPFELNSTIYRTSLVKEIVSRTGREWPMLKKLFPKDSAHVKLLKKVVSMKDFLIAIDTFRNPNTLETHCYKWCRRNKSKVPGYLYYQKLCASAIQVNTVNTELDNPIDSPVNLTVEALNEQYKQGYRFDIEAIEKNKLKTTHVGQEHFRLVKKY